MYDDDNDIIVLHAVVKNVDFSPVYSVVHTGRSPINYPFNKESRRLLLKKKKIQMLQVLTNKRRPTRTTKTEDALREFVCVCIYVQ